MLVKSARSRMVRPAMTPKTRTIETQPGERRGRFTDISRSLGAARGASPAYSMAGPRVTVHAIHGAPLRSGAAAHGLDQVPVTSEAVLLGDLPVARGDLDRLLEVLEREGDGVPEPVVRLRQPLRQSLGGQMTVDARGHVPVPALQPRLVLLPHDVA